MPTESHLNVRTVQTSKHILHISMGKYVAVVDIFELIGISPEAGVTAAKRTKARSKD